MGHPGVNAMAQLAKQPGVAFKALRSSTPGASPRCEVCATSKITKTHSRVPNDPAFPKRPYAVVSMDLFQPGPAHNGTSYMVLITCVHTQMKHAFEITNKTELPDVFEGFMAWVQRQFGLQIVKIVADNEPALFNQQFWARLDGLEVQNSSPMHPHQNGHAERSGGVVLQRMTLLLAQAGYDLTMWPLAAHAAVYLLNRTPCERLDWHSPLATRQKWLNDNITAWKGVKTTPDLRHIRAFGCKAFPMTRASLTGRGAGSEKLAPKGHIGYLAGYISSSQYLIWVPNLRRNSFINTTYVIFDESLFYSNERSIKA
ncbi:hypothetical protein CDD82_1179 [Ophiocordyceps australis]|uniref:Integrase catalytic domain-containing protein n=1 Tax=Ophiocordyceps australis TaxID=1399860 RepID=A0A2C5XCV4_9HYPO|nr:hypothetical protein CDD82_1179 [Ophiocordyceps australis]